MIRGIAARIRQLTPALLQPPLEVTVGPAEPDVRASARSFGGALYVIAVNAGTAPASVQLHTPELGARPVTGAGQARDGTLAVTLPARTVRIYIAAPE